MNTHTIVKIRRIFNQIHSVPTKWKNQDQIPIIRTVNFTQVTNQHY